MLFKDSLGKCDLGMLRSSRPAGLGLPRAGRWPVPRRRSWPRSVPAEPDGPRPSPRLFSARVHSATRDGPATYLMAKACRKRCISTDLTDIMIVEHSLTGQRPQRLGRADPEDVLTVVGSTRSASEYALPYHGTPLSERDESWPSLWLAPHTHHPRLHFGPLGRAGTPRDGVGSPPTAAGGLTMYRTYSQ